MSLSNISMSVVRGCLVVPVQMDVYEEMLLLLRDDVAQMIRETGVSGVIIDVSGIKVIDSHDFAALCEIGKVTRCLGAPAVYCGFRPGVVMTMINAGIKIPALESALNMEEAFQKILGKDYAEADDNSMRPQEFMKTVGNEETDAAE